jgi:RIO kinase 2
MKLDPTVMRTMDRTDFRVLEAIEMGQIQKQQEIVTLVQIHQLSNLRHGGSHKIVSSLLRDKLISHETQGGMDGYRLTNAGYDILALYALKRHNIVAALGQKIGTGKESDIYLASSPSGRQVVLKFHRLGRTSFRNVRKKRDYFNNQKQNERTNNWLFLSKLSAKKEYAFMKALYDVQYSVPQPIYYNRHVICMNLIRGMPLYQVHGKQLSVEVARDIYEQSITLISKLAIQHGLIHCDFNEYNLLVDLSGIQAIVTDDTADPYVRHSGGQSIAPDQSMGMLSKQPWEQSLLEQHEVNADTATEALPEPVARLSNGEPKPIVTLIDFPQMISIQHINGQEYYERDIQCIQNFFMNKLSCQIPLDTCPVTLYAKWENVVQLCNNHTNNNNGGGDTAATTTTSNKNLRMDTTLRASGFSQAQQDSSDRMLELYYFTDGPRPIASAVIPEEASDVDEEDEDSEEETDGDDGNEEEVHEAEEVDTIEDANGNNDKERYDNDGDNDIDFRTDTQCHMNTVIDGLEQFNLTSEMSSRDEIIQKTKLKVQQQVQERMKHQSTHKNKKSISGKRNMNKSYIKGKRVHADVF